MGPGAVTKTHSACSEGPGPRAVAAAPTRPPIGEEHVQGLLPVLAGAGAAGGAVSSSSRATRRPLLQALPPEISPLATADDREVTGTSALSREKPAVSSGPMAQTETLGTAAQAPQQEAGPWGRPRGEGPTLQGKACPARALWPPAATAASPAAPTRPSGSPHAWTVVAPSAATTFLLIGPAVASRVWLLGQQVEQAKPLIEPQTDLEPTRPSPRTEGSLPVSTVSVMPPYAVPPPEPPPPGQVASAVTEPGDGVLERHG